MQTVKIDEEFYKILINYNSINPSVIFKKGNVISTCSIDKTLWSAYKHGLNIEQEFAIIDLAKFLNTLNEVANLQDHEVQLHEHNLVVKSDNVKVKINYGAPKLVIVNNDDPTKFPSIDVEFDLKKEDLIKARKAASVLGVPEIAFLGDPPNIYLEVLNSAEPNSDNTKIELEQKTDKQFLTIFRKDNLKVVDRDYQVKVCKRGMALFKSDDLVYVLPVERNSEF